MSELIKIFNSKSLSQSYVTVSWFMGMAILITHYLSDPRGNLDLMFFSSGLIVVCSYAMVYARQYTGLERNITWSYYLLSQVFFIAGIAVERGNFSYVFLSLLPACVANILARNRKSQVKAMYLPAITLSLYFVMHLFSKHEYYMGLFTSSLIYLVCAHWAMALIFLNKKTAIRSIYAKNDKRELAQEDRYFYHDLANQTHGLFLFLSFKSSQKNGLTHKEVKALEEEVKILQSLLKDHFIVGHKNLINSYGIVSFKEVKAGLYQLLQTFLPGHRVNLKVSFSKSLDSHLVKEQCLVHYPTFFRIMTNLIKNIAEKNSKFVQLEFEYHDKDLHILIKNEILTLKEDKDLSTKLSKLIMNEDKGNLPLEYSGIGLESISYLTEKAGGEFHFYLEDGYWISKIRLPGPISEQTAQEIYQKAS